MNSAPSQKEWAVFAGRCCGIVEVVLEIETGELGHVPGQKRRQAVAVVAERVLVVADRNVVLVQAVAAAPGVFVAQAAGPFRLEAVQVLRVEAPVGQRLARQGEVRCSGRSGWGRSRRRPSSAAG